MTDDERPPFRVIQGGGHGRGGGRGGGRERDDVGYQLRHLTANLLRVAAGAGRSYDIERQVHELSDALRAARTADEHGFGIESEVLDRWLRADDSEEFRKLGSEADQDRWAEDGTADRHRAINRIIKGALRMAASRIWPNNTQEQIAENILFQGVRNLEEVQERRRREWALQQRAQGRRGKRGANRGVTPELSEPMQRALAFFCDPQAYPASGISAATVKALASRKLIAPGEGPFGHVVTSSGRKLNRRRQPGQRGR